MNPQLANLTFFGSPPRSLVRTIAESTPLGRNLTSRSRGARFDVLRLDLELGLEVHFVDEFGKLARELEHVNLLAGFGLKKRERVIVQWRSDM
jgi:hypothetical protein